jgi:hypothetical protein
MELEYLLLIIIFSLVLCCPFMLHAPALLRKLHASSRQLVAKRPKVIEVQPTRHNAVTLEAANMNRNDWHAKRKADRELAQQRIKKHRRHRGAAIDAKSWGAVGFHPGTTTENDHHREVELKNAARATLGAKRKVRPFTTLR